MPYVITTFSAENWEATRVNDSHGYPSRRRRIDGRPVTTLREAREAVVKVLDRSLKHGPHALYQEAVHLPKAGGTIGPLPNGTVIEVERTSWAELEV